MTTITSVRPRIAESHPWCSTERAHSRRCWWNWELARWICPATTTPAAAAPTIDHETIEELA